MLRENENAEGIVGTAVGSRAKQVPSRAQGHYYSGRHAAGAVDTSTIMYVPFSVQIEPCLLRRVSRRLLD